MRMPTRKLRNSKSYWRHPVGACPRRGAHLGCISMHASREDKGASRSCLMRWRCGLPRMPRRGAWKLSGIGIAEEHPSECTDDERPSMIGECFTFVKPDCSEHSRVPRSHSCFYACVLDLLTGGGS